MQKIDIPSKEVTEKTDLYLKGVEKRMVDLFRTKAKESGYNLNEFFNLIIGAALNDRGTKERKRSSKKPSRRAKTST